MRFEDTCSSPSTPNLLFFKNPQESEKNLLDLTDCGEDDRVSAALRLQMVPHPNSGKVPASLASSPAPAPAPAPRASSDALLTVSSRGLLGRARAARGPGPVPGPLVVPLVEGPPLPLAPPLL